MTLWFPSDTSSKNSVPWLNFSSAFFVQSRPTTQVAISLLKSFTFLINELWPSQNLNFFSQLFKRSSISIFWKMRLFLWFSTFEASKFKLKWLKYITVNAILPLLIGSIFTLNFGKSQKWDFFDDFKPLCFIYLIFPKFKLKCLKNNTKIPILPLFNGTFSNKHNKMRLFLVFKTLCKPFGIF